MKNYDDLFHLDKNIDSINTDTTDIDDIDFFENNLNNIFLKTNTNELDNSEIIEIDYSNDILQKSDLSEQSISIIDENNDIYSKSNNIFLFIDSEFKNEQYICLQVVGCFFLNQEFHLFSFIIFDHKFENFVNKYFPEKTSFYKNKKVDIYFSHFNEKNNVLTPFPLLKIFLFLFVFVALQQYAIHFNLC